MAIDVKRYQQLKVAVEKSQSESDRAQGALDELMKKLKTEFGCDTVEQADTLHEKLTRDLAEAEKTYNDALTSFEEEYGNATS